MSVWAVLALTAVVTCFLYAWFGMALFVIEIFGFTWRARVDETNTYQHQPLLDTAHAVGAWKPSEATGNGGLAIASAPASQATNRSTTSAGVEHCQSSKDVC